MNKKYHYFGQKQPTFRIKRSYFSRKKYYRVDEKVLSCWVKSTIVFRKSLILFDFLDRTRTKTRYNEKK